MSATYVKIYTQFNLDNEIIKVFEFIFLSEIRDYLIGLIRLRYTIFGDF